MNDPKIFLLSIGINTYSSDHIPNLKSCKKDTTNLRQTLINLGLVSEDNCLALHDEQASRNGIITAFRTHFQQMKDGDIAVLHYSGHGSRSYTTPEFTNTKTCISLEKTESIVPYNSDTPNVFNIADKELRWLVSELQMEKKNISFVAILDCCHAGSMLRDHHWRIKHIQEYSGIRPLDSYLDNQYQDIYNSTGKISLPKINYYALTASAPDESALEVDEGGFFTTALISILTQENGHLTYAQIHTLSHLMVKHKSDNKQHPQFEYYGSANPYRFFLKSENSESSSMPILAKVADKWTVNVGELHGIDLSNKSELSIYKKDDLLTSIGRAQIVKTYAEKSIVEPIWNGESPSNREILFLNIPTKQIALQVSTAQNTPNFKNNIDKLLSSHDFQKQFLINDFGDYELDIKASEILIHKKEHIEKKLLIGVNENTPRAVDWVRRQLKIISKWENILQLKSPKSSNVLSESISFSISYKSTKNKNAGYIKSSDSTASLSTQYIDLPNIESNELLLYKIEVEHKYPSNNDIYCFLIHLDRTFKIKQKFESFDKPIIIGKVITLYDSHSQCKGLGISDSLISKVEDHFILICSNTPLSFPYHFHQEGFDKEHGHIVDFNEQQSSRYYMQKPQELNQIWCIKKLTLRTKKE